MPDFNKGDFTQQGVAGHVNANLRLNKKRLVNIDLTSNEEAEGCTITGTVTDLLNDKVYGIGSGVSGNIEITENGENINVAPYATATVNVSGGGGDNLTLQNIVYDGNITTSEVTPGMYGAQISDITTFTDHITVTFENVVYSNIAGSIGNTLGTAAMEYGDSTFTLYPFFIACRNGSLMVLTQSAGTYALKIEDISEIGVNSFTITNNGTAEVTMGYNAPYDLTFNFSAPNLFIPAGETRTVNELSLNGDTQLYILANFNIDEIVVTNGTYDSDSTLITIKNGGTITVTEDDK